MQLLQKKKDITGSWKRKPWERMIILRMKNLFNPAKNYIGLLHVYIQIHFFVFQL